MLGSYIPIEYISDSSSDQLAVFSEVWYGPNKGWQAYIDNEPVEHIRANYILRALKIPAGKHNIVFKFAPKTYRNGNIIGLICSLIILGALLYIAYSNFSTKQFET